MSELALAIARRGPLVVLQHAMNEIAALLTFVAALTALAGAALL